MKERDIVNFDAMKKDEKLGVTAPKTECAGGSSKLPKNEVETKLAFKIGDRFISIHKVTEGYDYSIMGKDYKEIDGGVYDDPNISIREALREILIDLKSYPLGGSVVRGNIGHDEEPIQIDYDELMEKMEVLNTKKEVKTPLVFRLYQSIRFDRPIDRSEDVICPGGYELEVKDENGCIRTVSFDFEQYEGMIDNEDPCILHCIQKNPDYNCFEDLHILTEHMLANVTNVIEWFIYTGKVEPDEEYPYEENPLIPVEVKDIIFEIIGKSETESFMRIRMDIPVNPM